MRCYDHVFTVLGAGDNCVCVCVCGGGGGLPRLTRGSQLLKDKQLPQGSTSNIQYMSICTFRRRVLCGRENIYRKSENCCVCPFPWMRVLMLSSTALHSLLPAARWALSGNKSQEWIKHWRRVGHQKTRQWSGLNLGLGVGNFKSAWNVIVLCSPILG